MQMEELAKLAQGQALTVDPAVFQQLGTITRLLHDTMEQLGVMPKLQVATDGLPDARSRLTYIADKTAAPPSTPSPTCSATGSASPSPSARRSRSGWRSGSTPAG